MQIQMCNENGDVKIQKIVENLKTLQYEKYVYLWKVLVRRLSK